MDTPTRVVHDAKATFQLRGKSDAILRAMELVGFYASTYELTGTAGEAIAAIRADLDALDTCRDAFAHLRECAG